jgi:hypothetical protein
MGMFCLLANEKYYVNLVNRLINNNGIQQDKKESRTVRDQDLYALMKYIWSNRQIQIFFGLTRKLGCRMSTRVLFEEFGLTFFPFENEPDPTGTYETQNNHIHGFCTIVYSTIEYISLF